MTDTTDIKALRNEALKLNSVFNAKRLIKKLLDQLEAERQRADNAQTMLMPDGLHENTKAMVIGFANAMAAKLYKSEQKYGWSDAWMQSDWQDKCVADFNHHITKGDPLDVANYCAFMHYHGWPTALKGDQVPFRYMAEWSSQYGGMEYDYSEVRSEMDEVAAEHDGSVIELFTATQRPAVLPEILSALYRTGFNESYRAIEVYRVNDVKAAIEAAGGIVKDGE